MSRDIQYSPRPIPFNGAPVACAKKHHDVHSAMRMYTIVEGRSSLCTGGHLPSTVTRWPTPSFQDTPWEPRELVGFLVGFLDSTNFVGSVEDGERPDEHGHTIRRTCPPVGDAIIHRHSRAPRGRRFFKRSVLCLIGPVLRDTTGRCTPWCRLLFVFVPVAQPCHNHSHRPQLHAPPCLLYTSPSPRDATLSRMPSSA